MSNKPGRNDPCPCGSGRKYKRCCLPIDEAAARERARQKALFDDDASGDAQFDEDDDSEATSGGPDQSAEQGHAAAAVTVFRRTDVSRPSAGFDMSAVPVVNSPRMGVCGYTGET